MGKFCTKVYQRLVVWIRVVDVVFLDMVVIIILIFWYSGKNPLFLQLVVLLLPRRMRSSQNAISPNITLTLHHLILFGSLFDRFGDGCMLDTWVSHYHESVLIVILVG